MIHSEYVPDLSRFAPYYQPPMLMLGATGSTIPHWTAAEFFGQWVGDEYTDLDADEDGDADIVADLNTDLVELSERYGSVFNLGTLEHVWNTHNAWANALRAVRVGGYILSHGPITGFEGHGLHITNALAIKAFVSKNGFGVVEEWTRVRTPGKLLWLAARKERHIERLVDYEPAVQIYEAGSKKGVR